MSGSFDASAQRAAFRALHRAGCFALPNPWDAGSAVRLEKMGFKALASSSSAFAATLGRRDYQVTLDEILGHLSVLSRATSLPVNADFENGFADAPEHVAANVTKAIATGISGLSIEDRGGDKIYELDLAVERIKAAKAAITASGADVILVARAEAYLMGKPEPRAVIDRLIRFAEAGADCLYAPGITDMAAIGAMVRAVAPLPVNILMFGAHMSVPALADLGVRRVSVGGALANAAWRGFETAAQQFLTQGTMPN
jgi:2-methylisocitrate lyase-like PEP mutase family enzyme